jgi:hypothetical protein
MTATSRTATGPAPERELRRPWSVLQYDTRTVFACYDGTMGDLQPASELSNFRGVVFDPARGAGRDGEVIA